MSPPPEHRYSGNHESVIDSSTPPTVQDTGNEQLLYHQHLELLELNNSLEQRVAERTAELANIAAQAQQASAAKGMFLAKMSHEIRTPMNGIIGMLEALRTTALDRTQENFVNTAYSSAEILLALINDILDITKIEAGKLEIESTRFDLRELVQQVISLWKPQADEKQLQLLHEVLPDVPRFVLGDPTRLRQVLNNLVSNALKFTHEGGINIVVDNMCLDDSDPAMLRFAIQDTGIGMSPATQQALFSQFTQADGAATTRIYGGSGLGLAICKQLVELMCGEIVVDSSEGLGTCFSVVLPFSRAQQAVIEPHAAPAHTAAPARQLHILVVDDNETNRVVCTTILERLGYRTSTAVDGLEAVSAVQHGEYDMILMDCHMPIVDGLDATRSIRAWERSSHRPALPIIAVSASAFADDRQRCAEAGMNDFLPKPITLNSLRNKLDNWLVPSPSAPLPDTGNPPPATAVSAPAPAAPELDLPAQLFSHTQFSDTRALAAANFGKVLQGFVDDADRQVQTMHQALDNLDAEVLRRCAHKLKGSSGSVGAAQLARLCDALEINARNRALANASAEVAAIADCWHQTLQALRPFIAGS